MQDQLDNAMHCGTVGKDEATFCINIVSIFSWDLLWSQEKIKAILMQNFGGTNNDYYGIFESGPLVLRVIDVNKVASLWYRQEIMKSTITSLLPKGGYWAANKVA